MNDDERIGWRKQVGLPVHPVPEVQQALEHAGYHCGDMPSIYEEWVDDFGLKHGLPDSGPSVVVHVLIPAASLPTRGAEPPSDVSSDGVNALVGSQGRIRGFLIDCLRALIQRLDKIGQGIS